MKEILVVEDNKMVCAVINNYIGRNFPKWDVFSVDSGESGIEIMKECRPKVIITDLNLVGNLNGIDVIKKAFELYDGEVIIVSIPGDEKEFMNALRRINLSNAHFQMIMENLSPKPDVIRGIGNVLNKLQ